MNVGAQTPVLWDCELTNQRAVTVDLLWTVLSGGSIAWKHTHTLRLWIYIFFSTLAGERWRRRVPGLLQPGPCSWRELMVSIRETAATISICPPICQTWSPETCLSFASCEWTHQVSHISQTHFHPYWEFYFSYFCPRAFLAKKRFKLSPEGSSTGEILCCCFF